MIFPFAFHMFFIIFATEFESKDIFYAGNI